MQVNVEVGGRAKALDQRDCAAVGLFCLQASLIERKSGDYAVHDLQHGRHPLRLCGQQRAQRDRQRQNPLANRYIGNDVIRQVRRACAMRRAPHDGQNPRRLQLKATSLSWPQSPQRSRRKP